MNHLRSRRWWFKLVGRQDEDGRRRQWEENALLFVEHKYSPSELDALIMRLIRLSKRWEYDDIKEDEFE